MDSQLFLGDSEPTTLKELSQALGKETIDTYNAGETRGREQSHEVGEDGKAVYKDDAFPLTKGLRDKIGDVAIQSYERGGEEVAIEYDSVQKEQTKANPEKSGKAGVRQGKPSVLKILQENSKVPGADRPLKIAMEKPAKAAENVRKFSHMGLLRRSPMCIQHVYQKNEQEKRNVGY